MARPVSTGAEHDPCVATSAREATTPWQFSWPAWCDVLRRTWQEASKDNIGLVAAGVAFYGFLAIVPLLGAIVLLYGLWLTPARSFTTYANSSPSYVLLLGAEFNSELEHQTVRDTTSGGERPLGTRGAWAADHVAEAEPSAPHEG